MTNPFLLIAFGANALYQQIEVLGMIPLRQLHRRNVEVFEAIGFAARAAFKVDMVVLVLFFRTTVRAQCVAQPFIIEHLVYNAFFEERFECSVYGHTIVILP